METKDFQNLNLADTITLAITNLAVKNVMGNDNGLTNAMDHLSNMMDVCANLESMKYLHYIAEAVEWGVVHGKDRGFPGMAGFGMSEIIFMNNLVTKNLHSIKLIGNFLAELYQMLDDRMHATPSNMA